LNRDLVRIINSFNKVITNNSNELESNIAGKLLETFKGSILATIIVIELVLYYLVNQFNKDFKLNSNLGFNLYLVIN